MSHRSVSVRTGAKSNVCEQHASETVCLIGVTSCQINPPDHFSFCTMTALPTNAQRQDFGKQHSSKFEWRPVDAEKESQRQAEENKVISIAHALRTRSCL